MTVTLDRIDRQILDILQTDNRIANAALAEKIGLSAPACSRRVARLRKAGIIVKDVSIIDPRAVGRAVTVVVAVSLVKRQKSEVEAFERKMREGHEIQQCLKVAGSIDFFVTATLPDVESYAEFATEIFAGDGNVRSYESWFVLSEVKHETKLTLPG